jgi:hypothetical protein
MSLWRADYTIWHRCPHSESWYLCEYGRLAWVCCDLNCANICSSDLHIGTHWPKDNRSLALSCIKPMSKYKLYVLNEGLLCTWMLLFGEDSSIYYWWLLTVGLPLNAAVSLKWKGSLITSRSVSSVRSWPYFSDYGLWYDHLEVRWKEAQGNKLFGS